MYGQYPATSRTAPPVGLADALELVGCPIAITIIDTGRPTRILKTPDQSGDYRPSLETVVASPGPIDLE
jgi:hypothetical protein